MLKMHNREGQAKKWGKNIDASKGNSLIQKLLKLTLSPLTPDLMKLDSFLRPIISAI